MLFGPVDRAAERTSISRGDVATSQDLQRQPSWIVVAEHCSARGPEGLPPDNVRLHWVPLWLSAGRLAQLWEVLDPYERTRANRFSSGKLARSYVIARGVLRFILGAMLDIRPRRVRLVRAANGKPYIQNVPLQFSFADSGTAMLVGLTVEQELGVDVELLRSIPETELIAKTYFLAEEHAELTRRTGDERTKAFFRIWTKKEAYLKATGEGLSIALNAFSVGGCTPIAQVLREGRATGWSLYQVSADPAYVGAVAVLEKSTVHGFQFENADCCMDYFASVG